MKNFAEQPVSVKQQDNQIEIMADLPL